MYTIARAFVAVPEAVIQLQTLQRLLQAPIGLTLEVIDGKGMVRTRFPIGRRIADVGAIFGHLNRLCRQRIAIVKIGREIEACLERMNDADDVPRNIQPLPSFLPAWPVCGCSTWP
jgi:hypothetical protein